ncbi:MAG: HDIG domain-containing protein [Phycisphaerae bacterium]|nr:HDIG domain-containing protein [Phycisphaerae bacterium]
MFFGPVKPATRRAQIRAGRPDTLRQWWDARRADGTIASVWLALLFAAGVIAILTLRDDVVPYRPGQFVGHDIVARTDFVFHDADELAAAQNRARVQTPRVYRELPSPWDLIAQKLRDLPQSVAGLTESELRPDLQGIVSGAALTRLREAAASDERREQYLQWVEAFISAARKLDLVILRDEQRLKEVDRNLYIPGRGTMRGELTFSLEKMGEEIAGRLQRPVQDAFPPVLQPVVTQLTLRWLTPTHEFDDAATAAAMNQAAQSVPSSAGDVHFAANQVIVSSGEIRDRDWEILRAEARAFARRHDRSGWKSFLGVSTVALILTGMLATYIAHYQPRIVRNHARGIAVAVLLLAMLLLAQLSGISSQPMYVFALFPTLLVATILSIVYDRRFAAGVATLHGLLVTLALGEDLDFLLVLLSGVATICALLDEVRSRSKLIEIAGAAAVAMMLTAAATGVLNHDPRPFVLRNCLHAGAAGLGVGFVVLGILPFIEKAFRITTAMTLLELADFSHPLLRRISSEAPGTWNHSLQVAAMAEEAAEAIGCNSLLCRVGSYYHDCGKINKPGYFVENQQDGVNRHLNLSPNVSLLIIVGHVKDGLELAREYKLPTSIFSFIQQHHGTTLVEFFYDRAMRQASPEDGLSELQFRYPGPKPKTKEVAIVMLADCCESAARALVELTPEMIEKLVEDITRRRVEDGQLDECDMTLRELELVKRSLIKSLLGIHHGRIAYPPTDAGTAARSTGVEQEAGQSNPVARSA